MARDVLVATTDNPTIKYTGQAVFGKNHYCLWLTTDGSTSICTIQNPGVANKLTFVVSGAPGTIYTTEGSLFNGQHEILPNHPTRNVTAIGDFEGTQVTIFNMSALDTDCAVVTVGGSGESAAGLLSGL